MCCSYLPKSFGWVGPGMRVSLGVGTIVFGFCDAIIVILEDMPWPWLQPGIAIMLAVLGTT
jgi:hypothetical protein